MADIFEDCKNFFEEDKPQFLSLLEEHINLSDFCGFKKVPDASKITRFKQDFENDIENVFHNLVDITEPICKAIDSEKAAMLLFDTSGIEAWVTENNPKFANRIIKQLKAYAKTLESNNDFDPYKVAYGSMPSIEVIVSCCKYL